MTGYADLVRWAEDADVLSVRQVKRLLERARCHPADTEAVFQAARELREQLYRIFSAVAAGSTPPGTTSPR